MTTQARAAAVKAITEALMVEDIFDDLIAALSENLKPEDVFSQEALAEWAEENSQKDAD